MTRKDSELERETLRLNERYLKEVVEEFDLCPWAKRARQESQVARSVLPQTHQDPQLAVDQLAQWETQSQVQIGLLIFPRLVLERQAFERFATAVRSAHAARDALRSPPFALAPFHPSAPLNLHTPDQLVPFLRRSPDPTIQAVRITALEEVRRDESSGTQFVDPKDLDFLVPNNETKPSLRERIAVSNHRRVTGDRDKILHALEAIQADRDRSGR